MTRGAGWEWKVGVAMPGHSYKRAYFAFARYLSPSSGPVNARVVAALVTYRPSLLTEEAVVGVAGFPVVRAQRRAVTAQCLELPSCPKLGQQKSRIPSAQLLWVSRGERAGGRLGCGIEFPTATLDERTGICSGSILIG